jgi:flagellar protein FlaG
MYTTPLSARGEPTPLARKRDLPSGQVGETGASSPLAKPEVPEAALPLLPRPEPSLFGDAVEVSPEAVALSAQKGAETQQQSETQDASESSLKNIREAIQAAEKRSTTVKFSVDEDNGELIVKVVNKETGDVVREVPPEEVRELRKALAEMKGLLVKQTT